MNSTTERQQPMALRIPEVARELRVSVSTVYRLIAARELPAVQVGKRTRVSRRALEAFIERH